MIKTKNGMYRRSKNCIIILITPTKYIYSLKLKELRQKSRLGEIWIWLHENINSGAWMTRMVEGNPKCEFIFRNVPEEDIVVFKLRFG